MQLLTKERETVFRLPRSFVPAKLGLNKVCLPDWRCSVCNAKENLQNISVLRSSSDLQIVVVREHTIRYKHAVSGLWRHKP